MTEPNRDDDRPVTFLEWLGLTDAPNFANHRFIGGVVGVALSLLLVLTLAAAIVALIRSFTAAEAGLGTGGLIVALLGAPFLIWSTVLKHHSPTRPLARPLAQRETRLARLRYRL